MDVRLAEIRSSSGVADWNYCPTVQNATYVGARLISPKNKNKFLPWLEGPKFLTLLKRKRPVIHFEKKQVLM